MERSCRVTLPICYREITQLGDSSTNYQIKPGDRIFVSSRSFCEELKCCLVNETCERCCKCQTPCGDPSLVHHGNPYPRIAAERSTTRRKDPVAINENATQTDVGARLENPLSDSPVSERNGTDADAPALPMRRLPTVQESESSSASEIGDETTKSASETLGDLLDGQLPSELQPPVIPDSFSE